MRRSNLFKLESYFYELPESLIAQEPVVKRDAARLLIIDRKLKTIKHDSFDHLDQYLPPKSNLIVNNSKVIPARLLGRRPSGGAVELFLLNALKDGYSFEALLKPLKKIKEGEIIHFDQGIQATLIDKENRIVRFNKKNIIRHLKEIGHIPLPPYIKRSDTPQDKEDYQTVYAKKPGSVASPTAGLHFTKEQMMQLKKIGHRFHELTLHINYGTFKPVECNDIRQHPMHTEHYSIKPSTVRVIERSALQRSKATKVLMPDTRSSSQSIIAVGTTSLRVLESVAQTKQLEGNTDIFIYPGHRFKMVDALITNFHLPYSTLLMLVCAFGGYELVMQAYSQAIKERYRFFSYGDAMLII